jgi:hypothetical protein
MIIEKNQNIQNIYLKTIKFTSFLKVLRDNFWQYLATFPGFHKHAHKYNKGVILSPPLSIYNCIEYSSLQANQ